ncbi:T9SS type A sorting domain-containing protein [bacterium]|nr:T9SS type A sorting domain-containing protein [bacterium]
MKAAVAISFVLFVLFGPLSLFARNISIGPTTNEVNNDSLALAGGDTIFVEAGVYEYLTFKNFKGDSTKYISIINKGGKVLVQSQTQIYYKQGINIKNCRYLELSGTGDTAMYGFEIAGTQIGSGVDIREESSDINVHHFHIHHTAFAGIVAKDDPECDGRYNRGTFIIKNLHIHHNKIHHTTGEGLYIGNTGFDGVKKNCTGVSASLYPTVLQQVEVDFNNITNTGREAIQLFSVVRGGLIHHNSIIRYGLNYEASQSSGIVLGAGSAGNIWANTVSEGFGHALLVNNSGKAKVYNNLLVNAGALHNQSNILACGIYDDARRTTDQNRSTHLINNTIVACKNNAIKIVHNINSSTHVVVANNLCVDYGNGKTVFDSKDLEAIAGNNLQQLTVVANTSVKTIEMAGFKNALLGNFDLMASSPAINSGYNKFLNNITTDIRGKNRLVDGQADAGAYEYQHRSDSSLNNVHRRCKAVFYPTNGKIDGTKILHEPGDTFCLKGGLWPMLNISKFNGENNKPVVFVPINGNIKIANAYYGIKISESNFIQLGGDSTHEWQISHISGNGISLEQVSHAQLEYCRFRQIANNAILCNAENPIGNMVISHCQFDSVFGQHAVLFNNKSRVQTAGSVGLSYCQFNQIAGNAITLSQVFGKHRMYKNNISAADKGLAIDGAKVCSIYANYIDNCTIEAENINDLRIYGNVFQSQKTEPLLELDHSNGPLYLLQNTVLSNVLLHFMEVSTGFHPQNFIIKNNLFAAPVVAAWQFPENSLVDSASNYSTKNTETIFVDKYHHNLRLQAGSALYNKGVHVDAPFEVLDFNLQKPSTTPGIGAFYSSDKLLFNNNSFALASSTAGNAPLKPNVGIYPNPCSSLLYLTIPANETSIKLWNTAGSLVYENKLRQSGVIDLRNLPNGNYLLQIIGSQISSFKQIIIAH